MNILFVAPMPIVATNGGIQRVTDILAKEFLSLNHNVYFLCRREKHLLDAESFTATQYCINCDNISDSIKEYNSLLNKNNINVVIFQWVDNLVLNWLKNTPSSVKVISSVHHQPFAGVGYERSIARWTHANNLKFKLWRLIGVSFPQVHRALNIYFEKRNLKNLLQYSDKVCLLSNYYIERVKSFFPEADINKLCGINNPTTAQTVSLDISQKENIMLFVGRLDNVSKNIYTFIDVWKAFNKRYPDWKAFVVGNGPDLKPCIEYADKNKVDNLSFVGHCKNVDDYYIKAKAICLTSYGEGFPMVLVESMNYGCLPFVFNSFEAVYDIIYNTENGYISPAFNVNHMIDNLCLIAENNELYEKLSRCAVSCMRRYKEDVIANRWIELISGISK